MTTTTSDATNATTTLAGLPGDRTGGFLAALGLLALLRHDGHPARLAWTDTWNPIAHLHDTQIPAGQLPELLHTNLAKQPPAPPPWDPRVQPTGLPQSTWRTHARAIPMAASVQPLTPAAWLATAADSGGKPGSCTPTRLFTLSGQQRPGKIIATLHRYVMTHDPEQLIHQALFGPWRYHRAANLSMGFDPAGITDAAIHGKAAPPAVVPAVELLAVYGLTWFPVFDGHTTAVHRTTPKARTFQLSWPLWRQPLGPVSIHTLLTNLDLPAALGGDRDAAARLTARGVHTLAAAERAARGHQTSSYAVFRPATLIRP